MQHRFAAMLGMAGLALAQLTTPGTSNLGVPAVPGTRVPESNPGTAISPPAFSGPSAPAANPGPAASAPGSSDTGPAYSFGAAPPPVIAPGK